MGWRGATQLSLHCSSDATVISSVLEFAVEDEDSGEGGDAKVENQLPHIPHAEQEQVAQDNHAQQSEGLQSLQRGVEQVEVTL